MLPEISLNILDIAENSVKARAHRIGIDVVIDPPASTLSVTIEDDGCGMTAAQLEQVTDPFFTSRTTRKVGLGIPFFKQAAEITGGSFAISSEVGVGTRVNAVFRTDSIDCMPLGNVNDTILSLVLMHEDFRIVYSYTVGDEGFVLDTDEIHAILGPDVTFSEPEVTQFLRGYLQENTAQADASADDYV